MALFKNRITAGKHLATLLTDYNAHPHTIVLGLPRGGITVAFEIAKSLQLPLDVFLVRKLGCPGNDELAMGALSENDVCVFNDDLIKDLSISQQQINAVIASEQKELSRRKLLYRGGRAIPEVAQQHIILVDDGIATGATMRAAVLALQQLKPVAIIIAVPVAAAESLLAFSDLVDKIVCAHTPEPFFGVGSWYDEFPQVSDDEVGELLALSSIKTLKL